MTNPENRLTRITWEQINICGLQVVPDDFLLTSFNSTTTPSPKSPEIIKSTSSTLDKRLVYRSITYGNDIGPPIHMLYKSLLSTTHHTIISTLNRIVAKVRVIPSIPSLKQDIELNSTLEWLYPNPGLL